MMEQCGRYWAIRLADLQWTNTHCTTGQRSVTPHTHTLYDWTVVSYTIQCGRYWAIRLADLQWTNTHCTTGQRSVTPHTHTLYDWSSAVSTGQSDWPTCSGQTHTVRLDSGQLHHTHTHCMMEQCGRYWAIRLADLQWTNTHCTTGQRSVTPHTHTLYDGAVRPILGNQTGRPAVDKHTLYDWTAVSYTTHTHTV